MKKPDLYGLDLFIYTMICQGTTKILDENLFFNKTTFKSKLSCIMKVTTGFRSVTPRIVNKIFKFLY